MALRAATGARKWRPSVVVFFQQLGVGIRVEQVVELVGLVDLDDKQPAFAKASSLIVSGLSASALLTAVMVPDTGEYTSDAALTDSTTALAVPVSARSPTAGRST